MCFHVCCFMTSAVSCSYRNELIRGWQTSLDRILSFVLNLLELISVKTENAVSVSSCCHTLYASEFTEQVFPLTPPFNAYLFLQCFNLSTRWQAEKKHWEFNCELNSWTLKSATPSLDQKITCERLNYYTQKKKMGLCAPVLFVHAGLLCFRRERVSCRTWRFLRLLTFIISFWFCQSGFLQPRFIMQSFCKEHLIKMKCILTCMRVWLVATSASSAFFLVKLCPFVYLCYCVSVPLL